MTALAPSVIARRVRGNGGPTYYGPLCNLLARGRFASSLTRYFALSRACERRVVTNSLGGTMRAARIGREKAISGSALG